MPVVIKMVETLFGDGNEAFGRDVTTISTKDTVCEAVETAKRSEKHLGLDGYVQLFLLASTGFWEPIIRWDYDSILSGAAMVHPDGRVEVTMPDGCRCF